MNLPHDTTTIPIRPATHFVRRKSRGALALAAIVLGFAGSAAALTFTVFGPETFMPTLGSKKAQIFNRTFSVPTTATTYTLHLVNGGSNLGRVSSCGVAVNGTLVVQPSEINQNVATLDRTISVQSSNTLQLQVAGPSGSGITVSIFGADNTPPSISVTASPLPNAAGWNNTNVTATFTCQDTISGIASCSGPVTVTTEGAGQTVTGTAVDKAGNTATTTVTLSIDKTPPTVTMSTLPPPNTAGWNNSNVTVAFTCQDAISGVNSCSSPVTVSTEGANQVITGTATDRAGNTASTSVTINLDKTAPSITPTLAPTPNASGWNKTDVTITYACSDSLSGVQGCPASATVSTEGANQVVNATATDRAGNSATSTVTLNIDKTPPTIMPTASSAPNTHSWNSTDVTVSYTCTDALSGVASCPSSAVTSTEGASQVVSGAATDRAGNSSMASSTLNIDKTLPTIMITAPTGSVSGTTMPEIDVRYDDSLSGVDTATLSVRVDGVLVTNCSAAMASAACEPSALSSGTHQITAEIKDLAGNQAGTSSSFSLNLDTPPTISPIGDQTAPLGQTSTFTVHASDPDGDAVTLMVTPIPLPDHATFTGSTGVFTFSPTSDQIGSYPLTFTASDGKTQVSQSITVTVPVPQPTAPTTLEGFVLDANSSSNGETVPIVGATISLLGTSTYGLSDAQGHFVVNNAPAGRQVLDIAPGTGQPAPDGSPYGGFREAITLTAHVTNTVERPFFLPRIAIASVTRVNPDTTTVVTNSTLGVSLSVPAHTAKNPDGTDFVGDLSISLVPRGLAPAQLPPFLNPGLLVTIQPVGVVFANPIPITFPNLDHIPVGNDVDIWSLLASEGRFAVVGKGQVTPDGQSVQTVSGGVRAADWHFNIPPQPSPTNVTNDSDSPQGGTCKDPSDPPGATDPQACSQGGSLASLLKGSLIEDYALPSVRSLGVARSLRLVYTSTTADVQTIVSFDNFLSVRAAVPRTFSVSLSVGGVAQGAPVFYDATTLPEDADSTSRLGVQFDASTLPTGRYAYSARIFSNYEQSSIGAITGGRVLVVNQRKSPIGSGWGLSGVQRLLQQPDGSALITSGDGAAVVFDPSATGEFHAIAPMNAARSYFAATVLSDGRVLVTGGIGALGRAIASAEIFDPVAGTWTPTGSMNNTRDGHTATLLRDGRVLVVGGFTGNGSVGGTGVPIAEPAELYDPVTGRFTVTGSTNQDRAFHTATLLGDGEVLIAGQLADLHEELYSPLTGAFRYTLGNMHVERYYDAAATLPDGRVLVAGGQPQCFFFVPRYNSTEIYNPFTEQFTPSASMTTVRSDFTANLLPDGRVLLAGGVNVDACEVANIQNSVEIFDPVAGNSIRLTDTLCSPKSALRSVTLADGKVLLTGGYFISGNRQGSSCANLFDPLDSSLKSLPAMTDGRAAHIAVLLNDGRALVAGGFNDPYPARATAETFERIRTPGAYVAPAGDFTVLQQNPDGSFTRTYKDQTKVNFDASGLETSIVDRNNNTTTYAYDTVGRLRTMTDPAGLVWRLSYDANGFLQSITDPTTRVTTFMHDAQGNLTQIVKADGNSIGYSYDSQHRLLNTTDERGKVITHAYDSTGRLTSVRFPMGEVHGIAGLEGQGIVGIGGGTGGSTNPAPITKSEDVRSTTIDGNGHATNYTLNGLGALLTVTDPLGRATQVTRDSNSLPRQIIEPNSRIVTMTYDPRGNLLTSTEQNAPSGPSTTAYTYDPVLNQVTTITDPLNHVTTIDHDARGNPTTITDARGKATILTYDSRGLLTASQDPLGNTVQFSYDAAGNVNTVTDPRGKVITLTRDSIGNVRTSQSPLTRNAHTEYDSLDRITSVIDPLSGNTGYHYDEVGNLTSLNDANGHTTTFSYDDRNLLVATRNPLGQTKTYAYDAARNLDHVVDAKGQRIEFVYDDAEELVRKVLKASTGSVTDTVTYGYDLLGNLATVSDSDSGLVFTYDPLGRLSSASTTEGPAQPTTIVIYTYDKAGNRTQMTDPHGTQTVYFYDTVNRLTALTSVDGTFAFDYDDAGRRTGLNYPNGTRASYGYDLASQLRSLHYLDSTLALVSKFDYTYDDEGNRDSRTTLDGVTSYTFDALDQLTGAVGPDPSNSAQTLTESYTYDAVGNRTSSHALTGQMHDAANRLLEDSKFTYTYDANGNLTSKRDRTTNDLTTYDWDVENRLIAVHTSTRTVTFRYDPLGRRIERAGSTTTRYLYDQEDIVEELDGGNMLKFRHTHGPGIDESLATRTIAGQVTYYEADGLGSIGDTTDTSGHVSVAYRYDSFGNPRVGSANPGYAFTGREWDPETGLHFYRGRYYDPELGRFISEDALGHVGGPSFYTYSSNNPIRFSDPFGLLTSEEALKHYLDGSQTPLSISFSDVDTASLRVESFRDVRQALSAPCCANQDVPIDSTAPFSTQGDEAYYLGYITIRLRGVVSLRRDCSWVFRGRISALDDIYDFNPSTHRTPGAEFLTWVGAQLPGKTFTISMTGSKPFGARGRLSSGDPCCQ